MRKPATERLPVGAPCLRCGPLPLFSPQQVLSAVRPSNDSLSDNATDNREVREADPSPRPRIRNGFSSPASKDGGFQARNFCKLRTTLSPNMKRTSPSRITGHAHAHLTKIYETLTTIHMRRS